MNRRNVNRDSKREFSVNGSALRDIQCLIVICKRILILP